VITSDPFAVDNFSKEVAQKQASPLLSPHCQKSFQTKFPGMAPGCAFAFCAPSPLGASAPPIRWTLPDHLFAYAPPAPPAASASSKGWGMRCTWRGASEVHDSCKVLGGSILPEPIEAVGAKLGISHRVHDVAVPQVVLQRAGVDAVVGELEAAAMAQHVRMSRERKFGQFSSPADHFEEPGPRHRAAAFGVEDEAAVQVLPSQLAQC